MGGRWHKCWNIYSFDTRTFLPDFVYFGQSQIMAGIEFLTFNDCPILQAWTPQKPGTRQDLELDTPSLVQTLYSCYESHFCGLLLEVTCKGRAYYLWHSSGVIRNNVIWYPGCFPSQLCHGFQSYLCGLGRPKLRLPCFTTPAQANLLSPWQLVWNSKQSSSHRNRRGWRLLCCLLEKQLAVQWEILWFEDTWRDMGEHQKDHIIGMNVQIAHMSGIANIIK